MSGHILDSIATGIFYVVLNIHKILRILHEQNIVKFQRPKSHPIYDFKQKKTFHIKKQPLSFQNMLSKLWATHEMNFWERKNSRSAIERVAGTRDEPLRTFAWQARST